MKNQMPGAPMRASYFSNFSFRSIQAFIFIVSLVVFSSCKKEVIMPPADAHLPTLVATDPGYNETGVEWQKTIKATFDQTLDPNKFIVNFTMQKDTSIIQGAVSISGNSVVFTPDADLEPESQYIIAIDITDNLPGARAMEKHFISVFYTRP